MMICGGFSVYGALSVYRSDETFYKNIVMPAVRLLDAETSHRLAVQVAKFNIFKQRIDKELPILKTQVFKKDFQNPIGLAAGFDKNGEAVDGMLNFGFGFVEVGSVTPKPQPGNPRPRVFRLSQDKAVINRYGFNSDGHEAVYDRLKARKAEDKTSHIQEERNMLNINFWTKTPAVAVRRKSGGVLGINLGKNKTSEDPVNDYVLGVKKFGELADYLVINVSSPNTPGLRDMQSQKILQNLIENVLNARNSLPVVNKPPVLLKIAPDLSEQDKKDIATVISQNQYKVDGLIISNTTVSRPDSLQSEHRGQTGGLSGRPLKDMSTQVIKDMYTLTNGQVPIVGVGGVASGQDAYEKICAGACLVQIYTALSYDGPPLVRRVKQELADILVKEGFSNVADAVGKAHLKNLK